MKDLEDLPEILWHEARFPNNEVAWLKEDTRIFNYENHFIDSDNITFGAQNAKALKVRQSSVIKPEWEEYRSIVYILDEPRIYRVTHDLLARETHGEIIDRIESSFKLIK
jgi:hypothetical protein